MTKNTERVNDDEEETPDADVQQAFTRGTPYSRTSRTDPQMEGDTVTTNIPPNVRDLNRQFENAVRALTHPASSYPTRNSVLHQNRHMYFCDAVASALCMKKKTRI